MFKIFKIKNSDFEISEKLADQIINFDKVRDYRHMLDNFYKNKMRTQDGFFIFAYEVKPDYEGAEVARIMRDVCDTILGVYKTKKDTPEFDNRVNEIVKIFDNSIEKRVVEVYGSFCGYSIEKTPNLTQEGREKLIEFQYITLGPTQTDNGKELKKTQ